MKFVETGFNDLFVIHTKPKGDQRGWLVRTYSEDLFKKNISNFSGRWVQHNHVLNKENGIFRGFHFQFPPYQEEKLVRCIKGEIKDIVIDLRKNSPTFLKTFTVLLSSKNNLMLYIPKGFAHGYKTLKSNTELIYLHSEFYKPEYESGVRYNDPLINFKDPISLDKVSNRDQNHPFLTKNFKGL